MNPAATTTRFAYEVAGMVIEVVSDQPVDERVLIQNFQGFLTDQPPMCQMRVYHGQPLAVPPADAELIFDSNAVWKLFRQGEQYFITLGAPEEQAAPYMRGVFTSDFTQGDLYLSGSIRETVAQALPMPHPLPEILTVLLLAQGRGVMMHACGIADQDNGYLFCGHSGNGKSTMARLWTEARQGVILNDDRIILRFEDGTFWMYSTPWHGTFPEFQAGRVPLKRVFFLHHALQNQVKPLPGSLAAAALMARCFPTIWNEAGVTYTLDFLTQLAESLPCCDLHFVPDAQIIDLIQCAN